MRPHAFYGSNISKKETKRRLAILRRVMTRIDKKGFTGILLSGSVAFGKNWSVHQDSDIDLIFVLARKKWRILTREKIFNGPYINDEGLHLFQEKKVDVFWNDFRVDGVDLNMAFVAEDFFLDFLGRKRPQLRTFKDNLRKGRKIGKFWENKPLLGGGSAVLLREIKKAKGGFVITEEISRSGRPVIGSWYRTLLCAEPIFDPKRGVGGRLNDFIGHLVDSYGLKKVLASGRRNLSKASPAYLQEFTARALSASVRRPLSP